MTTAHIRTYKHRSATTDLKGTRFVFLMDGSLTSHCIPRLDRRRPSAYLTTSPTWPGTSSNPNDRKTSNNQTKARPTNPKTRKIRVSGSLTRIFRPNGDSGCRRSPQKRTQKTHNQNPADYPQSTPRRCNHARTAPTQEDAHPGIRIFGDSEKSE